MLNLAAQSKNDQAKAYYIEAEKNYGLENYQSALNNLSKVEEILGSTNARVIALKVKSYFEMGDFNNAKKNLNKFSNYSSSEALKNEILSYIVKIETKLEEAKINAERERNEDEKNYLRAKTTHTIESYNTYLNNPKNSIYRSEAKKILDEDEGFKQIRLAKKQLATPEGLTAFYFKEKTYPSPTDFEFLKTSNILKLGKYENYRQGRIYEVHQIHLSELNTIKIYKEDNFFGIKLYGGVDRIGYKIKKKGKVFDFKYRLNSDSEKYYTFSLSFKSLESLNQFIEGFKAYLNNQGYKPRFTNE